jgi:hypothetical protein
MELRAVSVGPACPYTIPSNCAISLASTDFIVKDFFDTGPVTAVTPLLAAAEHVVYQRTVVIKAVRADLVKDLLGMLGHNGIGLIH